MKITTIIIIAGAILVFAILVFAGIIPINLAGIIGDGDQTPPPTTSNCNYDSIHKHMALEVITGKNLNFGTFKAYEQSLHMRMCHDDLLNYHQVIDYFTDVYEEEGYIYVSEAPLSGGNWSATVALWRTSDDSEFRAVIAGGGIAVNIAFGHDTMYMTSYGTPQEWYRFWVWLTT